MPLRSLVMSKTEVMEPGGFEAIGSALAANTTLTSLDVYNCLCGMGEMTHIGRALCANTTLRKLKQWGCDCMCEGEVAAFAEALPRMRGLADLRLSAPSREAALRIIRGIAGNSSLRTLTLKVESEGWPAAAAEATDTAAPRSMHAALVEALSVNRTLEAASLDDRDVPRDAAASPDSAALDSLLARNGDIRRRWGRRGQLVGWHRAVGGHW